jgi:hypothetical protein
MSKALVWTVLFVLPLMSAAPCPVRADDVDSLAKDSALKFVRALKDKDVKKALKLAAVPWFDVGDEKLIDTEKDLAKMWDAKLEHLDLAEIMIDSIEVAPFAKPRDDLENESIRKELDVALGKEGRVVVVGGKEGLGSRFVLVQVRDGKAAVVGGPTGMAYFSVNNKIPKELRTLLEKAESVQLVSLDPTREDMPPKDAFHGWKVLGSTFVKGTNKERLVRAFKQGVEDSDGAAAGCFNPRHGIRVTDKDRVVDFVICFECLQVSLFDKGHKEKGFLTTGSPQPVFDKILKEAKAPLPLKAEE